MLKHFIRCRRGATAMIAGLLAIPVIALAGLGTEASSYYLTKRHAQNAADAAAYSAALWLASPESGTGSQTMEYRGRQFAAQNGFCTTGDTTGYSGSTCSTLPANTTQTVTISQVTVGSYSGVQATVSQTQPPLLLSVLQTANVTVTAQATAIVQQVSQPCELALTGPITFQGSPNINSPNCGMATNDKAKDALQFTGGGMTLNMPAGGCTGSTSLCNTAFLYMPPITNPFAALDSATLPTLSNCTGSNLVAYSAATPCKNNNVTLNGNGAITLTGGVYFVSGTLTLKGTTAITGTALFILLPGASFDTRGGGTLNITGNASVTTSQLPAALQPYAHTSCEATNKCLFDKMAIYDQSNVAASIGGNSGITFAGTMYLPNAAVTFQGDPTINNSTCEELIAASFSFVGNATLNNSGCSASSKASSQVVRLAS